MSIKMPNEEEKERSIRLILDSGLPKRQGLGARFPELIRELGLRNLFWGTWDCMFLALIGGITLGVFLTIPSALYQPLLPLSLMLTSPAAYGLLHFLTIRKEQQIGLYEIKMTCRYTLKELTALRMAFFGGAGAMLDVVLALCLGQQEDIVLSFFQMLGISLSALFLYGTATLFSFSRMENKGQWIVPAVWCAACIAPLVFHGDVLGLLMKIPGAAALAAALLSVVLFFAELEHYLSSNRKGGFYYAGY